MDAQFFIDLILFLIYAGIVFLLMAYIWRFWMLYINQKFLNKLNKDSIMLELKLPRDIFKSPEAMENIIHAMFQTGGVGTQYKRNMVGNLPTYFSLEIASLEGVIHFYIRMEKKFRPLIESTLYAQYPGIEVTLADDYTKLVKPYKHLSKDASVWGITYGTSEKFVPINEETGKAWKIKEKGKEKDYKMFADFKPIKTYIDYKLDKDPKEEYKNDPLVPLLEFMGQMGKGEYVWYQILVQDEAGTFNGEKFPETFVNEQTHKRFTLNKLGEERKNNIRKVKKIKKGSVVFDQYGNVKNEFKKEGEIFIPTPLTYAEDQDTKIKENELTVEEKDEIEVINNKLSKPTGRAVIRLMYVTKNEYDRENKKAFRSEAIQQILTIMRPFNGENNLGVRKISAPYDNPWEDLGGKRTAWRSEEMFEAYVEREGFYPHTEMRDSKEGAFEDIIFQNIDMKYRKIYRLILETLVSPFGHPESKVISVLNTEELATLYHFPGQVASVPTLPRIDSTKSNAPMNLPLQ